MRIGICTDSHNENISSVLRGIDKIHDVVRIQDLKFLEKKEVKIEGLVIEQNGYSTSEFIQLRSKYPMMKILLIIEEFDYVLRRVCIAHDIDTLSSNLIEEKLKSIVQTSWLHMAKKSDFKNVISVSGTHSQVGTTQTALSLAMCMKELNLNVCVLGLDVYNPGELSKVSADYSLDSIYSSVDNHLITFEKLKKTMVDVNGVHYLVGNRNFLKKLEFQIEPMKELIHMAKEGFDYVLLDLGSHYDHAPALAGLYYSNTHLLITTQQEVGARHFRKWQDQVLGRLGYGEEKFLLCVNKYSSHAILTPKQLEEDLKISLFEQIPYLIGAEDIEIDEILLYYSINKSYRKAIERIVKGIIQQEEDMEGRLKKKGFLGWFAS
jgi:MinD-like ATPase involved in chromosome partitioning or flagellar assembly